MSLVKGALFLYVETGASMVGGFLFWILMSKIAGADIIGQSASVISLATIFSTVGAMGINIGVQRFLGGSFTNNDQEATMRYIFAGIILTSLGLMGTIFVFLVIQDWIYSVFEISLIVSLVTFVYIISMGVSLLLRSIIISSIVTKPLPQIMVVSVIAKLIIGLYLVMMGWGALGVIIGFTVLPVVSTVMLTLSLKRLLVGNRTKPRFRGAVFKHSLREVFVASVPTWIPYSIYIIGLHMGPVVVYGTTGSEQAGVYSIAMFIAIGVSAASSALFSLTYPKMSGMSEGRKRLTAKSIKFCLIITIPLAASLSFYSYDVMRFLGNSFEEGAVPLSILLASTFPTVLILGVNSLVYSYGKYEYVMYLGLSSTIPRVILYFILAPSYGSTGASIAYLVGSIVGLLFSLIIARKIGLTLQWRRMMIVTLLPYIIGFGTIPFSLDFYYGIPLTIVLSFIGYILTRSIIRKDVESSLIILPKRVTSGILSIWKK